MCGILDFVNRRLNRRLLRRNYGPCAIQLSIVSWTIKGPFVDRGIGVGMGRLTTCFWGILRK
jgi:hypothetical protein